MPVKEIASRLISLNGETSVREALDSMLDKSIRNIGIKRELPYQVDSGTIGKGDERKKDAKSYRIINDRNILEFLLSHNGREVLYRKGIIRLADISFIDKLDTTLTTVNSNTAISDAAELLMDVHNPFLIYESDENEVNIITPSDIVMKLLRSDDLAGET